jgi:diguanylate cyclase (GGDEF)-like protein
MSLSIHNVSALSILRNINDGVIVVDDAGHVIDINPAARTLLGINPHMLPDVTWEQTFCCVDAKGDRYRDPNDLPLMRARNGEKFSNQIALYRMPEQLDIVLSINGQGLFDDKHKLIGGIITFRDITESRRRIVQLEERAQYDELTSLANRSLFKEQLSRAIGRNQRRAAPLAVLFIDIDQFKSVNDILGHDIGDALLCQFADRLKNNLRIGDFCGRWGGDEFVVCLENFSEETNATAAAQKLLLALSNKYSIGNNEVCATPSIGVAIYPDSGLTTECIIKAADIAMLEAKKHGGSQFQCYPKSLDKKLNQNKKL